MSIILAGLRVIALLTLTLPSGWIVEPPSGSVAQTGTMPQGMAPSPDGAELAVVEAGFNAPALSVYRLPSLARIANVPLADAFGRPLWADARHVLVAGASADAVFDVDIQQRFARRYPVRKGAFPTYIAALSDGRYAVADAGDDTVRIATLSGLSEARAIPLGGFPGGLASSADGTRVFAANRSGNTLLVINARSSRIDAKIATGLHPCQPLVVNDKIYVANSDDDSVGVYRYGRTLRRVANISVRDDAPGGAIGVSPNAISSSGASIYVSLGAGNSVAVVRADRFVGKLPAGWYPTDVAAVGDNLYVLDGKGEGTHPNPKLRPGSFHDYIASIEFGSLRRYALPERLGADGNPQGSEGWRRNAPATPIRAGGPIAHVFFILKENRSYDQVLGDVASGNGDPALAWFGAKVTPNEHAIAARFGLFDNAYTNGEVSANGHMWSDAAFANDAMERFWPSIYANRNDPDALNHVEGMLSSKSGFLWDEARRDRVSFRDYGELVDPTGAPHMWTNDVSTLRGQFDPHYEGWNLKYSDLDRFKEWNREFTQFVAAGRLPQFEFIWLPNDHTYGSKPGELTPSALVAQNDYAVGKIVEAISHSRVWGSSAIFVIEDDAQDGPDHVSDQRTTVFVASPFALPGVHHEHYSTVSILRTIEIVLGMKPLSAYDAMANPMYAAFTTTPNLQPYDAISPKIDITQRNLKTAYGAKVSSELDFSRPDAVLPRVLNAILARNH